MINRILLLAGLVSTSVFAAPLTIVFTGNATGTIGTTAFTNQPFTITFNSDTASVVHGTTCCVSDYTTPSGTTATFSMGTAGSGSFTDDQAVFVNQSEQTLGIWHFNSPDYLTVGNPTFATYTESSTLGATSGTTNVFPTARSMKTSAGDMALTSVSGVTVAVTVGTGTPQTPVISSVGTSYGTGLSQNAWITIKGTNLAPAGTPAAGVTWTGAAAFASGNMPDSLNGVTVTFNGKKGYIFFYCSVSASGICPSSDQINVLAPLDSATGSVQVVVSNGSASSAAFTANETTVSPSLFLFKDGSPYVTATHADYSLLGPASLYPGFSTPASVGETVVLWTTGFGLPTTALVAGSSTQTGALPTLPTCQINGAAAVVAYAGVVQPGLYQLNVVVPNGAIDGDNKINCSYGGVTTQDNLMLTVKR